MRTGQTYWVEDNIATIKSRSQIIGMGIIGNINAHPNVYIGIPEYAGTNNGKYSNETMSYAYDEIGDKVIETVTYTDVTLEQAQEIKLSGLRNQEQADLDEGVQSDALGSMHMYKTDDIVIIMSDDSSVNDTAPNVDRYVSCAVVNGGDMADESTWRRRLHTSAQREIVFAAASLLFDTATLNRATKEAAVDAALTVADVMAV